MYIKTREEINLYCKTWGEGRPVILIHGWPLSADSWDDVAVPIVEAGFKVIAYDRRGFGRSEQPWSGYDYDTLTDDLKDIMDAHQVKDATIVGFSMGGGEVARYMSRYKGENVSQAILISSIVPYMLKTDDNPNGVPQEVFDEMAEGMKKDRAAFFNNFFDDFYGVGNISKEVSKEKREWSRKVAMDASLKATLACAESFATTDFRPDLPSFKVPTLVIHGEKDQTVPIETSGKPAAEKIENAELITYPDGPHGVFASHKEELIKDVINFLKKV